jgi:hypothetical protein
MTATQRCAVTELYVDQCAHCRPPAAPPPTPVLLGPWFSAAYAGQCSECGEEFEADIQIRADGEGGWLAECCGGDAE